jgi:hypothetical protein
MLLDQTDIEELFKKKCHCFGTAVAATVGMAVPAGMATAANLALIGTAISAVGMIQQGQAQGAQANFQAGVARNNAIIAQQQATRARQQAAIDEGDFRRDQSDLMASRRSLMGGLGVTGAGSPLAVSSDFAGETEYNAQTIRNQGEVTANRLQQEVMNQQAQASLYGMQGRQAVTSSYYRAGGTLMSGMGSAMGGFKSPSAPTKSYNLKLAGTRGFR